MKDLKSRKFLTFYGIYSPTTRGLYGSNGKTKNMNLQSQMPEYTLVVNLVIASKQLSPNICQNEHDMNCQSG